MSRMRRVTSLLAVAGALMAITFVFTRSSKLVPYPYGDLPTATVRKGSMSWDVRGTGTLVRIGHAAKLVARVAVPDSMVGDIRRGQKADVDTGEGLVEGYVDDISPSPSPSGMRAVDIAFNATSQEATNANLKIEANIHLSHGWD